MELDRPELNRLIKDAAVRMLDEGVPTNTASRLDDQNPVIPLAVDVDGEVAMATLLSWSEQSSGYEPSLCGVSLFELDDGWCPTGLSSGVPPRDYPLAARRPAAPAGLHVRLYDLGSEEYEPGISQSREPRLTAALLASAEVESVSVSGRARTVPFHGYVPIAVRNPAEAVVTAVSRDGTVLETLDLRRHALDLFRELRQRDPDGWPFKIT
jgi:hypothetical protein